MLTIPTTRSQFRHSRGKAWPRIYPRRYSSSLIAYVVDMSKHQDDRRACRVFTKKGEGETFAEQKGMEHANKGAYTPSPIAGPVQHSKGQVEECSV